MDWKENYMIKIKEAGIDFSVIGKAMENFVHSMNNYKEKYGIKNIKSIKSDFENYIDIDSNLLISVNKNSDKYIQLELKDLKKNKHFNVFSHIELVDGIYYIEYLNSDIPDREINTLTEENIDDIFKNLFTLNGIM